MWAGRNYLLGRKLTSDVNLSKFSGTDEKHVLEAERVDLMREMEDLKKSAEKAEKQARNAERVCSDMELSRDDYLDRYFSIKDAHDAMERDFGAVRQHFGSKAVNEAIRALKDEDEP